MKTIAMTILMGGLCAAQAANLVPEGRRDLAVPFQGAGKMGMAYVPCFFPKDTDPAIVKKAQEVIAKVAAMPEYKEELGSSLQTVPYSGNAEEGAAYLRGIEDLYWKILDGVNK